MTTKPSSAPWADEPYALLSTTKISKNKVSYFLLQSASTATLLTLRFVYRMPTPHTTAPST